MSRGTKSETDQTNISLSRISELASDLNTSISHAIEHITSVNEQTRLLSFNAQIEASRAGGATGAAFGVVAQEIQKLSDRTAGVADDMRNQTQGTIQEVNHVSHLMASQMRGTRLVDLALNNIDLVDRNLYERTCDVRWWATDSSVVDGLTSMDEQHLAYAAKRMGIILSAYTVYYDLVLTDMHGKVLANGRPDLYRSKGQDASQATWFREAIKTTNGEQYAFETCHPSPLTDNKHVLAYSCVVRENGESHGKALGVLSALFNWDDLGQVVVKRTPLPAEEWPHSRVCIVDDDGKILADSRDQVLTGKLDLNLSAVLACQGKHQEINCGNKPSLVAHALAPGYETYSTGWHSIIIQDKELKRASGEEKSSNESVTTGRAAA